MPLAQVMTRSSLVVVWREPLRLWLAAGVAAALLLFTFADGLAWMIHTWWKVEEYGYGFFIPPIAAYLIWQRKDKLRLLPFTGSWAGFALCLCGVAIYFVGELASLYVLIQYAFLMVLTGAIAALTGWRVMRQIAVPLALLFFMIPLPVFLYQDLSAFLQLVSSDFGVRLLRSMGISVFLEGNVIDLGLYQLQVAEACNGLRYLFPLMSIGFIIAYLYKAPLWIRAFIFLSTIPITIALNSFRIGVIGILVEHVGISAAEGFVHDFEGWAVFLLCLAVLLGEIWLLGRIFDGPPLREIFVIRVPAPAPRGASVETRDIAPAFTAAIIVLLAAAFAGKTVAERQEAIPERTTLSEFPARLGDFTGRRLTLAPPLLDSLRLTDYALLQYTDVQGGPIDLYIAYYDSQRKGQSAHSPRSCIPGGGWEIASLTRTEVAATDPGAPPVPVNRVLIRRGDEAQLVYYWFKQRHRVLTNEYRVKWFIFWDALTLGRTDGALVRVNAPVDLARESVTDVDARLRAAVRRVDARLTTFVPD